MSQKQYPLSTFGMDEESVKEKAPPYDFLERNVVQPAEAILNTTPYTPSYETDDTEDGIYSSDADDYYTNNLLKESQIALSHGGRARNRVRARNRSKQSPNVRYLCTSKAPLAQPGDLSKSFKEFGNSVESLARHDPLTPSAPRVSAIDNEGGAAVLALSGQTHQMAAMTESDYEAECNSMINVMAPSYRNSPIPPKRKSKSKIEHRPNLTEYKPKTKYEEEDNIENGDSIIRVLPPTDNNQFLTTGSNSGSTLSAAARQPDIFPKPRLKQGAKSITVGGCEVSVCQSVFIGLAVIMMAFLVTATIIWGTSYMGLINAVLSKLEFIEDIIFEIATSPGQTATVFIERWEEILFKINPNFIALFIIVVAVAVFVPISGFVVCCCKICDRIDKLKTIKQILLGWRIYYIILLACCNGILIERIVRVALANHDLSKAGRELGPAMEGVVHNATQYFVGLDIELKDTKQFLADANDALISELATAAPKLSDPIVFMFEEQIDVLKHFQAAVMDNVTISNAAFLAIESAVERIGALLEEGRLDTISVLKNNNCQAAVACLNIQQQLESLNVMVEFPKLMELKAIVVEVEKKIILSGLNSTIIDLEELSNTVPGKIETFVELIHKGYSDISDEVFPVINTILAYAINLGINTALEGGIAFAEGLSLKVDEWAHYTALGGTIMIAILAVIIALFLIGMILGIVGAYYKTSHGSSALTGAITLGYIFSWIFLLVALFLFTGGAHLERYVCQGLYPNENGSYSAIQLVERIIRAKNPELLQFQLQNTTFDLEIESIIVGCENDESIFDLLNLNDALDIDVLLKDITNQTGVTISDEHINNSVLNGITTVIDMPNDLQAWGDFSIIGDYSQSLQTRFKDFYLANLKVNLLAYELNHTAQAIAVDAAVFGSNIGGNLEDVVNPRFGLGDVTALGDKNPLKELDVDLQPHLVHILDAMHTYSNMIVTNNLNKEVNEDYKIIMKSLENMEFTITNLNSDSISDAINDIKPNAILNIKEELYTVNAKLAELISYMLQKVESLGHGKDIYDTFVSARDFVCIDIGVPLNQYWLPLGWGAVVLILAVAFGLKFNSLIED